MELSILIVNYNVSSLLRKCLQSIRDKISDVKVEVIVIDNNSPDRSWKSLINEFPDVKFIASAENLGFSRANNLAAKHANGQFLLLLNPDTELQTDFMREVLDFVKKQSVFGCLGVRLHDGAGNFHPESKRSVPTPSNTFAKLFFPFSSIYSRRGYYRSDIPEYAVQKVDVLTGAFLLTETETFRQAGGLDEKYFMYGEDIDFCCTVSRTGRTNWYYGGASVLHHKGESTVKDENYFRNFYGAMAIFVDKYYFNRPVSRLLMKTGLSVRYYFARLWSK